MPQNLLRSMHTFTDTIVPSLMSIQIIRNSNTKRSISHLTLFHNITIIYSTIVVRTVNFCKFCKNRTTQYMCVKKTDPTSLSVVAEKPVCASLMLYTIFSNCCCKPCAAFLNFFSFCLYFFNIFEAKSLFWNFILLTFFPYSTFPSVDFGYDREYF
jgi:hypothetical protein